MAHGSDETLTLRPPRDGDTVQDRSSIPLYADPTEALTYFEPSNAAQFLLGKNVVQHYAHAARAELVWSRQHVTAMERRRGIAWKPPAAG
ncbi:hypothetical protein [Streptomyces sp. NPDC050534]|uniref:hypothetical protein n=1 Tax=Streptomyces sp. NPDC050534 TaxID=3365625 RepID=UPI0037A86700